MHNSHFDQPATRAARQFQSVSAPVVRRERRRFNIPVCALQRLDGAHWAELACHPARKAATCRNPVVWPLDDKPSQHTAHSHSVARRRLSCVAFARRAAAVIGSIFATTSHSVCCAQFPFCLAHSPAAHYADLEADSIACAPVVNICGADVATPVCAGLVPLRSLQTGSALRVTTGW